MARCLYILSVFVAFLFSFQPAKAEVVQVAPRIEDASKILTFYYDTKAKTLSMQLSTSLGKEKIIGNLNQRLGQYSSWEFNIDEDKVINETSKIDLIFGEKNRVIIDFANGGFDAGPYLGFVSPDSHFIVFDYGTGTGLRNFEIFDAQGIKVAEDHYLDGRAKWTSNGFVYEVPVKDLNINLNDKIKACASVGAAHEVEWYIFDGEKKRKLDRPPEIACSN
jgi:hypothetical protein